MDQGALSELAMAKPTPIVRDADALLRRGIEALERERHDEAVVLLRQAVSLAEQPADGFLALGIALMRTMRMHEAMAALELPPGPELGRLLRLLREAQAVGAVTTREAALDYIRRMRDRPLDTSELAP